MALDPHEIASLTPNIKRAFVTTENLREPGRHEDPAGVWDQALDWDEDMQKFLPTTLENIFELVAETSRVTNCHTALTWKSNGKYHLVVTNRNDNKRLLDLRHDDFTLQMALLSAVERMVETHQELF